MDTEERLFLIDLRNRIDSFLDKGNGVKFTATRKDNYILVEFNIDLDDIQYQVGRKGKYHSILEMRKQGLKPPAIEGNSYKIQPSDPDKLNDQWHVIGGKGYWAGDEFVLTNPEGDVVEKKSEEIDPSKKIINIVQGTPENNKWHAGVNGVLKIGDKWRVYFQDRSSGDIQVVYSESEDLESWSNPKPIGTTKNLSFVKHPGGQIYAYGEDDGWMCIWKTGDGINQYTSRVKAFQWKLDTLFSFYFHEENGEPRMFGRVRGSSEKGGWKDHPEIDRRGISYHKANKVDGNWESRILADPMDYFDYSQDLQPDFYQPSFRPDGTGEIVIFFRDKNNVITNPDGSTRITGPIYPVNAFYDNGMISIDDTDPAIDISSFEVGQVYIHPEKIHHNGETWRLISHRSDEHYRKDNEDVSGIYLIQEK